MNEQTQLVTALKVINLNEPSFQANGKTYFIESGLSIERYCEHLILEKELAFGMTFEEMMKNMKEIYRLLNRQELVASAVKIDAMVKGVAKLQDREPVLLKMCCLFINEENEDRSTWNSDMVVQKIDDWKKEGIDVRCFFAVASTSVNGLVQIYKQAIQIISQNPTGSVLQGMEEVV